MKYAILLIACNVTLLFMPTPVSGEIRLTIGSDHWPPYELAEKDFVTHGFSTQVVEAVLKRMDVKIEGQIHLYPFARLEHHILHGHIDAAFSLSSNTERQTACYFPEEPLIDSKWVLFIRQKDKNRLTFATLNDLKGKTIGVVRQYAYTPAFWAFLKKENNYETVSNDEQNFIKLRSGRIDYAIAEYANALTILEKMGLNDELMPLLTQPVYKTKLYVIFNKRRISEQFATQFSDTLKAFKDTPEYERFYHDYFASQPINKAEFYHVCHRGNCVVH